MSAHVMYRRYKLVNSVHTYLPRSTSITVPDGTSPEYPHQPDQPPEPRDPYGETSPLEVLLAVVAIIALGGVVFVLAKIGFFQFLKSFFHDIVENKDEDRFQSRRSSRPRETSEEREERRALWRAERGEDDEPPTTFDGYLQWASNAMGHSKKESKKWIKSQQKSGEDAFYAARVDYDSSTAKAKDKFNDSKKKTKEQADKQKKKAQDTYQSMSSSKQDSKDKESKTRDGFSNKKKGEEVYKSLNPFHDNSKDKKSKSKDESSDKKKIKGDAGSSSLNPFHSESSRKSSEPKEKSSDGKKKHKRGDEAIARVEAQSRAEQARQEYWAEQACLKKDRQPSYADKQTQSFKDTFYGTIDACGDALNSAGESLGVTSKKKGGK